MEPHQPFELYKGAHHKEVRRDLMVWLFTSLAVSLAPFGIVWLCFGIAHKEHGLHTFPNMAALFGGGELLLVILSVTGATLAEFWKNPGHLESVSKGIAVSLSLFVALVAGGLFTVMAYTHLIGRGGEVSRASVTGLSAFLLFLVAVIQCVTLLTRPQAEDGLSQ